MARRRRVAPGARPRPVPVPGLQEADRPRQPGHSRRRPGRPVHVLVPAAPSLYRTNELRLRFGHARVEAIGDAISTTVEEARIGGSSMTKPMPASRPDRRPIRLLTMPASRFSRRHTGRDRCPRRGVPATSRTMTEPKPRLRVITPNEPPELTPEAARILLRMIEQALAANDDPSLRQG